MAAARPMPPPFARGRRGARAERNWTVRVDMDALINPSPVVYAVERKPSRKAQGRREEDGEDIREPIDALEVFEHIRDIVDPEHPYSLEQLHVVSEEQVECDDGAGAVTVEFTPTVEHCSMATLIGLCIRVKLLRVLPPRFKVDIRLARGSHASEAAVNKQLNDKERVAAALENPSLLAMVDRCLAGGGGAGA
eukprot:scaffold2.g6928.t1